MLKHASLVVGLLVVVGCGGKTSTPGTTASCGNGTVDSGEQCDGGNLNGADCASQIGTGATGTLACTNTCTFDTSGCIPALCGNLVLDAGEQCDGNLFGGADCASATGNPGATGTL